MRRELRVRLLPNRARVEDDDVRVLGLRYLAETQLLEHALDALGIVSVHLAAEGRDVVSAHREQDGIGGARSSSAASVSGLRRRCD